MASIQAPKDEHLPICTKYPVDCPNKSLGCQWAGERGDLDQHLNESSVEGECQFVTVACSYSCGEEIKRCEIMEHKMNECPSRPFTCQYCNYEATYTEVTIEHWLLCEKYPLQCPNDCGGDVIKRQDLEEHLDEECPLQVVECEFSHAGCEFECQRQYMQDHVSENMKTHLFMVSTVAEEKIEEQNARIVQQDSTIKELQATVEQQQKQIVALMSTLTRVVQDVQKPLTPVFVTPPDMVMTDFEVHRKADNAWFSPPFYSHIGGYKMCLRVNANGCGDRKGTHVSVYVHLMRGEHDDQLKWPFRGDITIQLLNQRRDRGHREPTLPFDDRTDNKYAGRVVGQERTTSGWGYREFIAQNELSTKDKEYLTNDCLKFRISNITVN